MANNLYQQLNNQQPQINNNLKQVLDLVKNSKLSPKDLFYQKAKEMGVDPESILKQLR